jgi:hypothetical protein
MRTITVDIGTRFRYDWEDDDNNYYGEEVTVMGYIYYEDMLFYCCVTDSGVNVDVSAGTVESYTVELYLE